MQPDKANIVLFLYQENFFTEKVVIQVLGNRKYLNA